MRWAAPPVWRMWSIQPTSRWAGVRGCVRPPAHGVGSLGGGSAPTGPWGELSGSFANPILGYSTLNNLMPTSRPLPVQLGPIHPVAISLMLSLPWKPLISPGSSRGEDYSNKRMKTGAGGQAGSSMLTLTRSAEATCHCNLQQRHFSHTPPHEAGQLCD